MPVQTPRSRKGPAAAAPPLLEETSGASRLAGAVRRRIEESGLREGDLFATEAQLAEDFGVSRRVAREAVSYLRALGILRVRRRKGLLVGAADPVRLMSRSVRHFGRGRDNMLELARLRYALEVGAADLAVANASAQVVAELSELANQFEQRISEGPSPRQRAEIGRIELAFHRAILEATGSPLIAGMHGVLVEYFAAMVPQLAHMGTGSDVYRQAAWQHQAIAAAFRNRDVEQVRSLLRLHLQDTLKDTGEVDHAQDDPPARH